VQLRKKVMVIEVESTREVVRDRKGRTRCTLNSPNNKEHLRKNMTPVALAKGHNENKILLPFLGNSWNGLDNA